VNILLFCLSITLIFTLFSFIKPINIFLRSTSVQNNILIALFEICIKSVLKTYCYYYIVLYRAVRTACTFSSLLNTIDKQFIITTTDDICPFIIRSSTLAIRCGKHYNDAQVLCGSIRGRNCVTAFSK